MDGYRDIGTKLAGRGRRRSRGGEPVIDGSAACRGSVLVGRGVRIGRGCIIEGDVEIGDDTRIDDYCIIRGRVQIGARNWLYPFCVIGTGPEDFRYPEDPLAEPGLDPPRGRIAIGSDNTMREFTTIHMPTVKADTSVGSGCHMLAYTHVSHDGAVGDRVTMASGTTIGGHCRVDDWANLGFNVSVHPGRRIGAHSMVAMMMPVVKDVPPYALVNRQRFEKINRVGMQRAGMTSADIGDVEAAYRAMGGGAGGEEAGGRFAGEIRRFVEASRWGCYRPEI